jgi:hypothetical protein
MNCYPPEPVVTPEEILTELIRFPPLSVIRRSCQLRISPARSRPSLRPGRSSTIFAAAAPALVRQWSIRFTASAHRMTGQSVDPRLVFLSVKKSLPLGHGCDRLAYPEVALLKIVSK